MFKNFNGRTIRKVRRAADMTQSELAELAKLPGGQTQVSKIERWNQHVHSWQIIERVRRALNIK